MAVKIGETRISDIQLGTTQIDKVYKGTDVVWEFVPIIYGKCLVGNDFTFTTENGRNVMYFHITGQDGDGKYNYRLYQYQGSIVISSVASVANAAQIVSMVVDGSRVPTGYFTGLFLYGWTTIQEFHSSAFNLASPIRITMHHIFTNAQNLEVLDMDFTNVIGQYGASTFQGLGKLRDFSFLRSFYRFDITYGGSMFSGALLLTDTDDLVKFNFANAVNIGGFLSGCSALTDVSVFSQKLSAQNQITDFSSVLKDCASLVSVTAGTWYVNNMTDCNQAFGGCTSLRTIGDISGWPFSQITNTASMFSGDGELQTICANGSITLTLTVVTNTSYMFRNCMKLTDAITVAGGASLTQAAGMFQNCNSATFYIDDFDTSHCTTFNNMFFQCSDALKNSGYYTDAYGLKHSNVVENLKITSACINISGMLPTLWSDDGCLDVSNWDTTNVTHMTNFAGAEVNVIFGEGFFNTALSLIPLECLAWLNDKNGQWLTEMFNILANHPKTLDSNWEGQTIRFSAHTWNNVIFEGGAGNYTAAAIRLQSAMSDAEEAGWMFTHV